MKKIILILLLLFVISLLFSQNQMNKELFDVLSQKLIEEANTDQRSVEMLSSYYKLPLKVRNESQSFELVAFRNNRPVYKVTHNAGGALYIKSSRVYPSGGAGLNLTGTGETVAVWDEGMVRSTHQELSGRVTQSDGASTGSDHATHVAGTMIAGGTNTSAKGMSYQANINAYDWNNDASEMLSAASNGLKVSNHSYGSIAGWAYGDFGSGTNWYWFGDTSVSQTEDYWFGFYDTEAYNWDVIAYNSPNYSIVKSAGNDRGYGPSPGTSHYYWNNGWVTSTQTRDLNGGSTGYDCIITNGTAKNIITVGAIDTSNQMSSFSSWGPCDDGRIKPDIVAKGVSVYSSTNTSNSSYATYNGTSMASPMISGSIGLIQQHYQNLFPAQVPLAATVKALIIHTANDLVDGTAGPDYRFGWGLMDTEKACSVISDHASSPFEIQELTINNGETIEFLIKSKSSGPLRVTIVWTDVPGTAQSAALDPSNLILVNDLDMRLFYSSTEYKPYILNPSSPSNSATTGDNFRDNVEMIHLSNPVADAVYTLRINHKSNLYNNQSQNFSLIISGADDYAVTSAVGNGTSNAPYQISTLQHLYWLSQDPTLWDKHFILNNNIDMATTSSWYYGKGWTAIGDANTSFTGSFNGNANILSNMLINKPVIDYQGLFGKCQNAEIKNINMINANVTGRDYTALLVGYQSNGLNFEHCSVQGNINGRNYCGGIAGYNDQTNISQSWANVSNNGSTYLGALCGFDQLSTIDQICSKGSIIAESTAGGLIGKIVNSQILNAYNRANVIRKSGFSNNEFGACIGHATNALVQNAFSTGSVTYLSGVFINNKGFTGYVNPVAVGTFTGNFFDMITSQQNSDAMNTAVGKMTPEMTTMALIADYNQNIYLNAGWDFAGENTNGTNETWNIGNSRNDGYPYLVFEYPNDSHTLPVYLSSFFATTFNQYMVKLEWQTESENNLFGYHIYRNDLNQLASSQRISWQIIPARNSNTVQNYEFSDQETEADHLYYYWLQSIENNGESQYFGPVQIYTNVEDELPVDIDMQTRISSAYPNPFNPNTLISYEVSQDSWVEIDIFNTKGQYVRKLESMFREKGRYTCLWDGRDDQRNVCATGVYYCVMKSGNAKSIRKITLMK